MLYHKLNKCEQTDVFVMCFLLMNATNVHTHSCFYGRTKKGFKFGGLSCRFQQTTVAPSPLNQTGQLSVTCSSIVHSILVIILLQSRKYRLLIMHRFAKFQTPPNAVDLL